MVRVCVKGLCMAPPFLWSNTPLPSQYLSWQVMDVRQGTDRSDARQGGGEEEEM